MTNKRSFPFDPITGKEIRNRRQPGYYPGYSTMAQKKSWEKATRDTVTSRLEPPKLLRFFSPQEAYLLQAIIDRILPQDDRAADTTIPILEVIDERLDQNSLSGFRYANMPPDQEAYRRALKAIDEMAQERFALHFISLEVHRQELILKSLQDGRPDPPHPLWAEIPIHRFWALLMGDCVTAYYAHPFAWDEIGFGGPAYPRGYMRLENGLHEPWEKPEQRYEWNAPADSISDLDEEGAPPQYGSTHGHGGTH